MLLPRKKQQNLMQRSNPHTLIYIFLRDDEFRMCFKVTVDGEQQQARNVGLPPFEEYEKEMAKVRISFQIELEALPTYS